VASVRWWRGFSIRCSVATTELRLTVVVPARSRGLMMERGMREVGQSNKKRDVGATQRRRGWQRCFSRIR
jgi:hypothetical protein